MSGPLPSSSPARAANPARRAAAIAQPSSAIPGIRGALALRTIQAIFASALLLCTALVCVRTLHWPLVGDSSFMHYAVFLLDSGARPYVDFRDVNLPGAYAEDWLVVHLLGPGALAERLYDFALSAIALAAMLYLCPSRLRFAGLFAGCLFFLIHARDGPRQIGQRDLGVAVLILLTLALSVAAARSRNRWPLLFAGLLLGMATLVKPVAIVFAAPLLLAAWLAGPDIAGVALTLPGFLAPLALTALWLQRKGALDAFLTSGLADIRYHASLDHLRWPALFQRGLTPILPLVLVGIVLMPFVWRKLPRSEFPVLCSGVAAAIFAFTLQGKGYAYQRYPLTALLLLTLGLIFTAAMREGSLWQKALATAALAAGCLAIAPLATRHALAYRPQQDQFGTLLTADLQLLGLASLQSNVQCLDTFSGCIRVLNSLHLHETTSTLYDEFLFNPSTASASTESRAVFGQQILARPPHAIILTPQFYAEGENSYSKLLTWPDFNRFLAANYRLYVQRTPSEPELWEGAPRIPLGYRIYLKQAP